MTPLQQARDALRPFAEARDELDDPVSDAMVLWETSAAMTLTAGDLRRAAALLPLLETAIAQEGGSEPLPTIGSDGGKVQRAEEFNRRIKAPAPTRAVPEGWVMVPREPTPEMCEATMLAFVRENKGIEFAPVIAYRAMIAAAPLPPSGAETTAALSPEVKS